MRQYVWMLHSWKTTEELKKVVDSMQKRQPLFIFTPYLHRLLRIGAMSCRVLITVLISELMLHYVLECTKIVRPRAW